MDQQAAGIPDPTPQLVFQAITAVSTGDTSADALLRRWETDAAAGFLQTLLAIVEEVDGVAPPLRQLAAIVAKNAVGSSWRKTMGSREWSRIPSQEKGQVKEAALRLLFREPSDVIALQLGLLITNIARFDFPSEWPNLLSHLQSAVLWNGPASMRDRQRALFTLKNVIRALRAKRFVIEPSALAGQAGDITITAQEMAAITRGLSEKRERMVAMVGNTFPALAQEWQAHVQLLIHGPADLWQERANLGNQCLFVLREILQTLAIWDTTRSDRWDDSRVSVLHEAASQGSARRDNSFRGNAQGGAEQNGANSDAEGRDITPQVEKFFEGAHHALQALQGVLPDEADPVATLRAELASLTCERITQCITAAMDKTPAGFASYLPHFLPLFTQGNLLNPTAHTIHQFFRGKRRVVATRFLSRSLLCPLYRTETIAANRRDPPEDKSMKQQWEREMAGLEKAEASINSLFAESSCGQLVEAIVAKYLALSEEELQEWREDPEGFVRSGDVEASPDADTPRACGVALLLCMLERGGNVVAHTLMNLASRLQGEGRQGQEVVILREAVYRGLGEALMQMEPLMPFAQWWQGELRHLVVSCLQAEQQQANSLQKPVTASLLAGAVLEDEQFVRRRMGARMPRGNWLPNQMALPLAALFGGLHNLDTLSPDQEQNFNARLSTLEQAAPAMLPALFELLGRVEEVESRLRGLQLVSIIVEVLGAQALPVLGTIAQYLPQLWTAAKNASNNKETGSVTRLHSALIAVLTHLISRLGHLAISHAAVESVLFPLLSHSLDVSESHGDILVDEALPLVQATLTSSPSVTPNLQMLLPYLVRALSSGADRTALFHVVESYLVIGNSSLLQESAHVLVPALLRSVEEAQKAQAEANARQGSGGSEQHPGGLALLRSSPKSTKGVAREVLDEAMAASGIVAVLLATSLQQSAHLLAPVLRVMAGAVNIQTGRGLSLAEAYLEALSHLLYAEPSAMPQLLNNDEAQQAAFFDKWLSAATAKKLEEVLGFVGMTPAGRLRRHKAAVAMTRIASSGCCPALSNPQRLARVLQLVCTAAKEQGQFAGDQGALRDALKEDEQGKAQEDRDHVAMRKLALSYNNPLRQQSAEDALQALLHCSQMTHQQSAVLEALSFLDHHMESYVRAVLSSPHAAMQNLSISGQPRSTP
ncbi:hypothetical protein WJX73_006537 [Symbiochloris irregularis]|uniref:Importin N-terminal domain-containing protein n=1 Tax=Symbiochloris irregularis TaxID=706552 RepID=A0AAW1NJK1_9CHLO